MEEYEVDLRDYFRVIWERKWIVLGIFVAAVVASTAFSYTLPDEYEAGALLQRESRLLFSNINIELPSSQTIIELMRTLTGPGVELRAEILNNDAKQPLISVKLRGSLSPQQLEEMLTQQIAAAENSLMERIHQDLQQELALIEQREEFLSQQRDRSLEELQQWVTQRIESLQRQREGLIKQIEDLFTIQKSSSEENLLLQANILALTGQLQAVHGELIRLETERGLPFSAAESGFDAQLIEIERTLQQLALSKFELQRALEMDWRLLRVIRNPQGSPTPVGPPRRLNIAIAGVLGLFVGLLLAFFIHYLQSAPPAQAQEQVNREAT